jgi:hypothetical protein
MRLVPLPLRKIGSIRAMRLDIFENAHLEIALKRA